MSKAASAPAGANARTKFRALLRGAPVAGLWSRVLEREIHSTPPLAPSDSGAYGGLSESAIWALIKRYQAGRINVMTFMLVRVWLQLAAANRTPPPEGGDVVEPTAAEFDRLHGAGFDVLAVSQTREVVSASNEAITKKLVARGSVRELRMIKTFVPRDVHAAEKVVHDGYDVGSVFAVHARLQCFRARQFGDRPGANQSCR